MLTALKLAAESCTPSTGGILNTCFVKNEFKQKLVHISEVVFESFTL